MVVCSLVSSAPHSTRFGIPPVGWSTRAVCFTRPLVARRPLEPGPPNSPRPPKRPLGEHCVASYTEEDGAEWATRYPELMAKYLAFEKEMRTNTDLTDVERRRGALALVADWFRVRLVPICAGPPRPGSDLAPTENPPDLKHRPFRPLTPVRQHWESPPHPPPPHPSRHVTSPVLHPPTPNMMSDWTAPRV